MENAMQATLTSKGQLTLPKALREKLSLSAGDRLEFIFDEEQGVRLVARHGSVRRLRGMLPRPERPVSLEAMDKAILEGAGSS